MIYVVCNPADLIISNEEQNESLAPEGTPAFYSPGLAMDFLSKMNQTWDEEVYPIDAKIGQDTKPGNGRFIQELVLTKALPVQSSLRMSTWITICHIPNGEVATPNRIAAFAYVLSSAGITFRVSTRDDTSFVQCYQKDREVVSVLLKLASNMYVQPPELIIGSERQRSWQTSCSEISRRRMENWML